MISNILKIIEYVILAITNPADEETKMVVLVIFIGGVLTTLLVELIIIAIVKIIKRIKNR